MIREMTPDDWEAVRDIYQQGINTGNATFEPQAPDDFAKWDARFLKVCRLVACADDGTITGWAALSPYSSRCVYQGVAEVSLYVHEVFRGQGIGRTLLASLIEMSENIGFWSLQAGIFPENTISVELFQSLGFRKIGIRERICKLNGIWRDALFLERRSQRVGI